MTGLGIDWTGRFRRVSPIATSSGDGLLLSPKPALSLDGGNRFSCPIAAIRNILRIGPVGGKRWPVFGCARSRLKIHRRLAVSRCPICSSEIERDQPARCFNPPQSWGDRCAFVSCWPLSWLSGQPLRPRSATDRLQSSSVRFTRPRLSAPTTARTTWNTNFSSSTCSPNR